MRAVCLECGASKWGALTECSECKQRPQSFEDQARSMLASEDHLDETGLEALSEQVRRGDELCFDPAEVADLAADLERFPVAPLGWTLAVVGAPFLVLVGLTALALLLLGG